MQTILWSINIIFYTVINIGVVQSYRNSTDARNDYFGKLIAANSETISSAYNNVKKTNKTSTIKDTHLRDYTGICPDGWNFLSGTNLCQAPVSYQGPCAVRIQAAVDKKEKQHLEVKCNLRWPQLIFCERDYSKPCPLLWEVKPDLSCQAPIYYSDFCEPNKHFLHFTDNMKHSWSIRCNAFWPCKNQCVSDYTAKCPSNWTYVKQPRELCRAPFTYTGPCGPEEITLTDPNSKAAFEEKCDVKFPCKTDAKCSHGKDYMTVCPINWSFLIESDLCQAPTSYTGRCDQIADTINLTKNEKMLFEKKCDVEWPCFDACIQDFTQNCPLLWTEKDNMCVPTELYTGPCKISINFDNKTIEQKEAFINQCKVSWPCTDPFLSEAIESAKEKQLSTALMVEEKVSYKSTDGPINPFAVHT